MSIGAEFGMIVWFIFLGGSVTSLCRWEPNLPSVRALVAPLVGLTSSGLLTALIAAIGLTRPMLKLVVAGTAVIVVASIDALRRRELSKLVGMLVRSILMLGIGLVVLYNVMGPVLTFDSFRFVLNGRSLRSDRLDLGGPHLASYPLLVVHTQAIARSIGAQYSTYAVGVTAAAAIVGALGMVLETTLDRSRLMLAWVGASAACAGVFASAFILRLQLTYLNSHLAAGAIYAVAAAIGWSTRERFDRTSSYLVIGILLAGLCITRMEGLLNASLVLTFLMTIARPTRREAALLGATALTVPVIWFSALILSGTEGDILSPTKMAALLAIAVGTLAVSFLPNRSQLQRLLPYGSLVAIALALLVLLIANGSNAATSVGMFLRNALVTGGWGPVLWILVPLAVAAALFSSDRDDNAAWTGLIMGFVLVVVCLGSIRFVPYRTGWGDSGNRMLVHAIPALMLFIVLRLAQGFATRADPPSPARRSADGLRSGLGGDALVADDRIPPAAAE